MKRYLEHMHRKPTHDRRRHALQVAGVLTAIVFVGWVTTLGVRLGTTTGTEVTDAGSLSQAAAAITSGYAGGNQLIVSTTTGY